MLLPATCAEDTVESLFARRGPAVPWIYRWLLGGALVALLALNGIEVDVAARAPGIVRATSERVALRSTLGGEIAAVLVSDDARVTLGQPLLQLRTTDVDIRLARNEAERTVRQALLSDLRLLAGRDEIVAGEDGDAPGLFRTAALRQEWSVHRRQREANRLAETKAASEQARVAQLADRGIVTEQERDNARYEVERLRADARTWEAQALARWEQARRDAESAERDLAAEADRLADERARHVVRAPVAGTLLGFSGWHAGGTLGAGTELGAISPDDALVVEARIPSASAGLVRVGQHVRLQIDAYAYTWWGTLDGVVIALGGDAIQLEGGMPGFKVLIRPVSTRLVQSDGRYAELRKGLTLSARFLVGRRTLWQLLHDEAGAWLNPQDRRAS